jgi:hypothetical protein
MDNQEFSQEELVTEVIAACEVGDLDKVKDLIPKVSFQSPYNEKYADSKKIFIKACLSGNLDIVKFLIDTPYSSSTMNYHLFIEEALTDITNTADSKNYNIIPYLLKEPKLNRPYNLKSILGLLIGKVLLQDNLGLLNAFLNLDDPINLNVAEWPRQHIVKMGCANDGSKIIKHFFTTPYLEKKLCPFFAFKEACLKKNSELQRFFIFDLNIEKTEDIFTYIKNGKYDEAEKLFNLRDLNTSLTEELDNPKETTSIKKSKL